MAVNQFVSHPAESTPHQELPGTAQDLDTLIRLFDEILQDDYCRGHGSLDVTDLQERSLRCSFCGSCLFLSGFFCRGCSQERSTPVLLCPGCYIEGRSCRCNTLSPVRLGGFPDALQDRNNAVSSLSKAPNLHSVSTENLVEVSER